MSSSPITAQGIQKTVMVPRPHLFSQIWLVNTKLYIWHIIQFCQNRYSSASSDGSPHSWVSAHKVTRPSASMTEMFWRIGIQSHLQTSSSVHQKSYPMLVRAALCRQFRRNSRRPLFWSERRCADGFVETAVGHYFWYFSTYLVVILLPPLLKWHKGVS